MKNAVKMTVILLVLIMAGNDGLKAQRGMMWEPDSLHAVRYGRGMNMMHGKFHGQPGDSLYMHRMPGWGYQGHMMPGNMRGYFPGQHYGMRPGMPYEQFRGQEMGNGFPLWRHVESLHNLTDKQKTELQALRKSQGDEMKKFREDNIARLKQIRENNQKKLNSILTDEQKKQLESQKDEFNRQGRGPGR
jgi:hypothetical protein